MGKIKSAIITAILVAGLIVLAFFATVSYPVPGTNKVDKHNSFISTITLGGDLTGEAVAVLYPKGVVSAADYEFGIPDVPEADAEDYNECKEKYDKYVGKYEQFGSVYVEYEALDLDVEDKEKDDFDKKLAESVKEFVEGVKRDAKILSKRLGEKGYSSYSVAVRDDFTIVVNVPTNYSYADYSNNEFTMDENSASDKQTLVSNAISRLAYGGELMLCNEDVGTGPDNVLTTLSEDANMFFKGFKAYSRGGKYAVRVKLTDLGVKRFEAFSKKIVDNASNDKAISFKIGKNTLLPLNIEDTISQKTFYITVDSKALAEEYATVLNSCINGESLKFDYGTSDGLDIVYMDAALGKNAAIYLFCSLLAIMVAAIIYSFIRYKALGSVNTIVMVMYALTMIVALMLINIQLTVTGAIFLIAGFALLVGTNFVVFEKVRSETKKGKTMQSAIKSAYKSLWKGVLEMHAVLIAVSLIVALVCVGELAACGLIFFIASIASYILHWFTRFMWFVISSMARDKFAFGGFKREELEDD